ncbi:type I polyketide synthase [Streptomyces candidus]|uniref:Acyl transferase domain-containing protein/NADPH:quinone reductase-like Zn-dependent oxidoreductase/SAM-dependent methyltransferase/acyl carrier protein n=1 Tax=Streptomyces candidus TaxID=67283 RepID=A0A7X0LPJ5_9ACTN|nr:type I polyketide synthase [Streptomyces candidus]MBB6436032.1 acyl transferase domain-containing protein/NADPH:quinone reductase-like Zn-dependent oxidoreductase/SAM-dependent methyltransferase/acyl carrier protein [Streptomyces candidus]GHH43420.1 polyketide synthase [Streptomyces candidus]
MAVVGIGLRLPGGIVSMNGLWRVLDKGLDVVSEVPADRFDPDRFTDSAPDRAGKSYTAAGGFLTDVASFDADYFGISPKEAGKIDPQQRLLLECSVEALNDAAIAPSTIAGGDCAVVMGLSAHDYADLGHRRPRSMNAYTMSGGAACNAANRVSYFFDLHGPSTAVDTACASALTAIHQGCEILRSGQSSLVLAGGVNVLLAPGNYVGFSQASMLSPTGRCRPFSASADGFVRSEGAGVLVLKPLAAAIADGDRVHAVIEASGVNSDGRTAGLSLPNPEAQAHLLSQVYEQAHIDPRHLAYLEAHGTGTQAGDPVECMALGKALGSRRDGELLPIGSVKSNLGHLEAASGIPSVLKAMLVLRERRIPATLHAEPANGNIDFAEMGLEPVVAARPLAALSRPMVGVNSFGFGGANAHVVLAPAPQPAKDAGKPRPRQTLLMVSGHTQAALSAAAAGMADAVESRTEDLYDIAYTATRRRGREDNRVAVLASDARQASAALRAVAVGDAAPSSASAASVSRGVVGFVFAGNASQRPGMGRDLLGSDQDFGNEVRAVSDELEPLLGWSVLAEMRTPQEDRWQLTEVAQPMLFALQAGLTASLAARGINPAATVGHSVGEVAAAYAAGILDRASACRVIAERSRAQGLTAGTGSMAALGLGQEAAQRLLTEPAFRGRLSVAGINSDRDVTVAGESAAMAVLAARAGSEGWYYRELGLNYAFHTPAMDAVRTPLLKALAGLQPRPGRIAMASTVTGASIAGPEADAEYWWRNVREPVLFAEAVRSLTDVAGCDVLVEVGPHPVLGTYLRRITAEHSTSVAVVPSLSRSATGSRALDTTLAHVVATGADIDWDVYFPRPGHVVALPAYPWQRERHWTGEPSWWLQDSAEEENPPVMQHPLLGTRQSAPHPTWHRRLDGAVLPWLADHKVGETVVMPAAAYVDMALASAATGEDSAVEVVGLDIPRALPLPLDDPDMDIHLHSQVARDGKFTVASRTSDSTEWTIHAEARTRPLLRVPPAALELDAVRARIARTLTSEELYSACASAGLPYGPAFQVLSEVSVGESEVLARYNSRSTPDGHAAHPTILDGALQAGMPLLTSLDGQPAPYLPARIDVIRSWSTPANDGFIHVKARTLSAREAIWDVTVLDAEGTVSLELLGCHLNRFDTVRPAQDDRLTEALRAAPLAGAPARPAPLPPPAQLVASCAATLDALLTDWQTIDYGTYRTALMDMVSLFFSEALTALLPGRTSFDIPSLIAAGVHRKHTQLLLSLTGIAERCGALAAQGTDRWDVPAIGEHPTGTRAFQDLLRNFPDWGAITHVYGICAQALPAVLRGDEDPLDILFSDTDALAARFYDHARFLQYSNRAATELLRAAVRDWPEDRPLRILEVGAGTGGTTAHLLPHVPPERTTYTYTDVSSVFLPKARARFAAYDFLDYRCLDLESDPSGQGFESGSFDIVVASNVLHATSELDTTVRRLAHLLADNGHLIALECHSNDFLTPVFGLLNSFWRAADTVLRPHGPLLSRADWPALLTSCGFAESAQVGDTTEPGHSDFSVILASRAPRDSPPGRTQVAPAAESRHWLVADLHEDAPSAAFTGQDLLTALTGRTEDPAVVVPASTETSHWTSRLASIDGPADIVLIAGELESSAPQSASENVRYCAVLRALAAACDAAEDRIRPTVWIVVRTPEGPLRFPPAGPRAGTVLWGAARTLANEMSHLTVRKIAVSCAPETPRALDDLLLELTSRTDEDEVVLSGGGRFVPRVRKAAPCPTEVSSEQAYTLGLSAPGLHYRLAWKPMEVPAPGPGQVVVRVRAAALNYRDIMAATGLVPPAQDESRPDITGLGLECSGTVTAVGPGVSTLAPGDRVTGVSLGCFGSHAVTRADRVLPIPEGWTFAEAATVPTVFVTVLHSLQQLARLTAGETILIHGAAGGVGMAALQYSRHVGARVIATAGTPAKRQLLRLMGADHVLDSRSLHFADQVRDLTDGAGVDVVLNSLAGQALVRSLELLKPGGRFVELGKRDFLADSALPLAPFVNNLTFHGVDVTTFLLKPSAEGDALVAELQKNVAAGTFTPLPHLTYPAARIEDAFTCLQHSRHLGKVVVTFDRPVPALPATAAVPLDPDATYLVTGGTGGFGAATARHLAVRGARHLTLVSRRGQDTQGIDELLADLRRLGAQVAVHSADAADPKAMGSIFEQIDLSGRRLGGVIHAAMVLNDAPFTSLTDEQFQAVLHPKLGAGLVLDAATRHRDLDFFVVYSSMSVLVGNSQQAPYVAANLALEALVADRVQRGRRGQAVRFGAISDAGYVQRNQIQSHTDTIGLTPLTAQEALDALDVILADPDSGTVSVGNIQWGKMRTFLPTLNGPRYQDVLPAVEQSAADDHLRRALAAAETEEEALGLAEDALTDILAHVLQTSAEHIDRTRRLDQLGVDSLMAAEITTLVKQRFGRNILTVELTSAQGLAPLARRMLTRASA